MDYFSTSQQHILAELERIDLLIRAQVWRAQQRQGPDQELQGFYISEQEIERLLAQPIGLPYWAVEPAPLSLPQVQAALQQLAADIEEHKARSQQEGIRLRLAELTNLFQLTPFEVDALLICLAPELDLRYERLFAYLQDDINKKRPTVDLLLNLLCPSFEAKLAARQCFTLQAPLLNHYLLHLVDDPSQFQPPLLSKFLKVDERVVNFLLDADQIDSHLVPYAQLITPQARLEELLLPDDIKQRLAFLVHRKGMDEVGLLFYLQGACGVGKQTTAEAICGALGLGLLVVDSVGLVQAREVPFEVVVRRAGREALLRRAALYWDGFDSLLVDEQQPQRETMVRALAQQSGLTFLAGNNSWEPTAILRDRIVVGIEFPRPTYPERKQLWRRWLNGSAPDSIQLDLAALAGKFRFSEAQIRDSAATAHHLALWRNPEQEQVTMADLYAACHLHSNRKLATLAQKISPHYTWDDIVLPPDRLEQLREICNSVKYRARVYEDWGFDRKLALGKGLNVLFAGPSGTGKTMAAEIIAEELGLDLYKIDLSTVVSKYIGETEKNLARIFAEAETSNAILFFDEADALFGKRTEVRDAHDRYANLETSYLLQQMEAYEGVVILATNLRKNMDEAFVRRMHFTIEFPLPGEKDRRRIWTHIWPEDTPRHPNLDLDFMARHFELSGGNIRNIALAAAFLAAGEDTPYQGDSARNGQTVNMAHLIHATQREYQKMGKVILEGEFGDYAGYISRKRL